MTAETLTSSDLGAIGGHGLGGNLKVAHGTYSLTSAVEDGDIFEMVRLPAGATVVGGYLMGTDMDTNDTEELDMDIGWAANGDEVADVNGFGALGTITGDASVHLPAGGMFFPLQGVLFTAGPKTFNKETVIQVEVNTASATWANGVMTLVVFYVMP